MHAKARHGLALYNRLVKTGVIISKYHRKYESDTTRGQIFGNLATSLLRRGKSYKKSREIFIKSIDSLALSGQSDELLRAQINFLAYAIEVKRVGRGDLLQGDTSEACRQNAQAVINACRERLLDIEDEDDMQYFSDDSDFGFFEMKEREVQNGDGVLEELLCEVQEDLQIEIEDGGMMIQKLKSLVAQL
jgi:hypothetical protein